MNAFLDITDISEVPIFMSTPPQLMDRGFYRWPAGPETWLVCDRCNLNNHRCHFCGDDLRHAEDMRGPNLHACYVDADPSPPTVTEVTP